VFYTGHRKEDLLYASRFMNWQKKDNFDCHIQVGRFKDGQVLNELPKNWPTNTVFLVGGPSAMMHHWIRLLKNNGAGNGQIYYEEFSW